MDYATNIKIFATASTLTTHGVLGACYCKLVTIELALKHATNTPGGHDIPTLLQKAAIGKAATVVGDANNLATSLTNDLDNIKVTSVNGSTANARGKAYPDIRYTRLQVDSWPAPATAEGALVTLNGTIDAIRAFMINDLGLTL
jgi:hypothetical protein